MWERIRKWHERRKNALLKLVYKIGRWGEPLYERCLLAEIKERPIPQHIGIILDGNRRWARARGLPLSEGYRKGFELLEKVVDCCLKLGIKELTLYVLSTENLRKRVKEEIEFLLQFFEEKFAELNVEALMKNGIRVKAVGKPELLPETLCAKIKEIEEKTKENRNLFLNFAIAYGGQDEIVDAMQKIAEKVKAGALAPEEIDKSTIEQHLYTAHLPQSALDLLIRTGGEERISNFLLWQSAYSEFVFYDVLWPDFRPIDFYRAIRTYQQRERRFGK